jgi:hypothetical protein
MEEDYQKVWASPEEVVLLAKESGMTVAIIPLTKYRKSAIFQQKKRDFIAT